MPKRIPTPPPGDDEPRYFTVVHPYACHGICNMELPNDRKDFARWVACCIDKDAFFAVFHKPSSRGMVIIEVNKDYAHYGRILGEHRWSEFLHKPTEEEKARVTQVFHCTYNTGRIVQKNGWKRIDVNEAWFRSWSPNNSIIKCPYPPTHFCDVPVEDRTNHSLCRPLPGAVKIAPVEDIVAPVPVVGSAAWHQTKEGGPYPIPFVEQSKPKSAWDKGVPKVLAASAQPSPTANGSTKRTVGIPQAANTGARMPAIGGGPITVKSNNVWTRKSAAKLAPQPVPTTWEESALVSRESTPGLRGVSPATAQEAPAAPPGLPTGKNVWECGTTSYPIHPPGIVVPNKGPVPMAQGVPDRTSSLSTSCWDSTGTSTSSPDSESGPDLTTATESDDPYAVRVHFSEYLEEEFHGLRIRPIDDGDLRELDSIAPGDWDEPTAGAWETTNNGWDKEPLEAQDLWEQDQVSAKEQMLCSAHGVVCKKGICAEYAKQVRLAKRAEEYEKRKTEFANRGKKGNGRGKGRGAAKKKNDDGDDDEGERRVKKTTQNNAFRGSGAPVKTNWRGAPREIISPDAIEQRETTNAAHDLDLDGWGNPDSEVELNVATVTAVAGGAADGAAETASEASWGMSENVFDPWAPKATAQPVTKANKAGGRKPQGNKKKLATAQAQTKPSSSWADQVDAELNGTAGDDSDMLSAVSSNRGSKRGGGSTAGWGASDAQSSTGGWGSVANNDMPW